MAPRDVLLVCVFANMCGVVLHFVASCTWGYAEEESPRCPKPELIGVSNPPTDYERQVINGAKIKCSFLYDGACLKRLEQVEPRRWKATCARSSKSQDGK